MDRRRKTVFVFLVQCLFFEKHFDFGNGLSHDFSDGFQIHAFGVQFAYDGFTRFVSP